MSSAQRVPPAAPVVEGGQGPPVEGDGYRVSLEKFDGPLDLLLHLIKRDEIDIHDIPIAHITEQYLESIRDIDRLELDLDRAGEFLLMAATLMRIKSRTLVPSGEEEPEEEEDPRAELVRRLVEYREFKRVAEHLRGREEEWRDLFLRPGSLAADPERAEFPELGVSLVDLFRAFQGMLNRLTDEEPLELLTEEHSVGERMERIRTECRSADRVSFRTLFGGTPERGLLVATFLALLELIRLREIVADQVDRFGEIWIRARSDAVVS